MAAADIIEWFADEGQRLALLLREQCGNGTCALAHQASSLAHDLGPLNGRHVTPGLKALLRGGQRQVQVGNAGMRDAADFLAGSRVEHSEAFSISGITPFAYDEELGVGISHACILDRCLACRRRFRIDCDV
jgi:hypothetical protein